MRSTDARAKALTISVERVTIPPWSTIGFGLGVDEESRRVRFASDWRPLRDLGEALVDTGEPIEVEVADWQVLSIEEASR